MKLTGAAWILAAILGLSAGALASAEASSQKAAVPATGQPSNSPASAKKWTPPPPPMPPPPTRPVLPAGFKPAPRPTTPAPAPPPAPTPPPQVSPTATPLAATTPPGQLSKSVIAWDAEIKDYQTKPGEFSAPFTFYFTNVSASEVTVNGVGTSCGCTVAQLPTLPWKLPAGTNGVLPVTMNVAGKSGVVIKTVTFSTDKGSKTLMLKVTTQPPPPTPAATPATSSMNRERNQELAKQDRQAVFKGDCASCHVEKAKGKLGGELYAAACGICHEAEHRATMVPDLHAITQDTNPDFWRTWIARGKPGSLMPAFAQSEGGPLNDAEINSLVQYLVAAIPPQGRAHAGATATAN